MIYFISGHGNLSEKLFQKYYVEIIQNIIDDKFNKDHKFVIGDCDGFDAMAQKYLSEHIDNPNRVTVYHTSNIPKNLINKKFNLNGGYKTDEEKNIAMTNASHYDIAFLLPNKINSETAKNICRRNEITE